MTSRGLLHCHGCQGQTSLTAGTIFQDTRKPLRMWFMAMWYVTNQKNGVSALGLQRVLGLGSYETAWTWLHRRSPLVPTEVVMLAAMLAVFLCAPPATTTPPP